jgi:hypothetical protein
LKRDMLDVGTNQLWICPAGYHVLLFSWFRNILCLKCSMETLCLNFSHFPFEWFRQHFLLTDSTHISSYQLKHIWNSCIFYPHLLVISMVYLFASHISIYRSGIALFPLLGKHVGSYMLELEIYSSMDFTPDTIK